MEYLEIQLFLSEEYRDIIIAELDAYGYDTFLETADGLNTYQEGTEFNEAPFKELIQRYAELCTITYEVTQFPAKNWNEEWEKNFEPAIIAERCIIKAPFHTIEKKYPLEIILEPKMAFGTGHHATTYLMLEILMDMPLKDKRVLDLGTGTGILSIAAHKLGSKEIWATDINDWSIDNSAANFNLNGIGDIKLLSGQIEDLEIPGQFDVVLANINRNVLLEEIPSYIKKLRKEALLVLSGFYQHDRSKILNSIRQCGLLELSYNIRNDWTAMVCSFENSV